MSPEIILILGGFLILVLDLFMPKESSRRLSPWLGMGVLAVVIGFVVKNFGVTDPAGGPLQLSNYLYVLDDFGNVFKLIFAGGAFLTLLMSIMASAYDLITLFVGLELLSISSYVLVGMRRNSAKSTEGAMKYLVVGSIATAVALYGMSFIYGVTGQTNIAMGAQTITQMWAEYKPLIMLGFLLMLAGLGVKVALVPFHMWAPDTYEGAGNPVTSFLAVVSKAAGFALLIRVMLNGFFQQFNELYMYLAVLAALTMVIGNVAALSQKNIKRLLAYSSVAQAGYLLIPLAVLGKATSLENVWLSLGETVFYLAGYLFMTMGAFAVLTAVTREAGTESIEAFRGLYKRAPFQAVAMTVFMLSMAGMPITAGFFGKFYIFLGAINSQMYWLAGLLFLTSAIAFYYYFGVLKAMYMKDSEAPVGSTVEIPWTLSLIVWIGLIGTVGLGVAPDTFLNVLNDLHWFG